MDEQEHFPTTDPETPTASVHSEGDEQDTGIRVCHVESKTRYTITARLRQGDGLISVDGEPITVLIDQNVVARFAELMRTLQRERLRHWHIDLRFSDPSWRERLAPEVVAYALNEALTNLLARL